jgi:spore coat protein CotH
MTMNHPFGTWFRNCSFIVCALTLSLSLKAESPTKFGSSISTVPAKEIDEKVNAERAKLFDDSKLLNIEIEIEPAEWKKLCAQSRDMMNVLGDDAPPSPYTYFHANITVNGVRYEDVGIRKKGSFGSMDPVRPGLVVKLDEYHAHDGIAGLKRLTLNNNKQDTALVSQPLSYSLFRKAGLPAPRVAFVKLLVNGEAMGVYSHVETVDANFLEDNFGSSSGVMYEGTFPTDFYADRLSRFETQLNKKADDRKQLTKFAELLSAPPEDVVDQVGQFIDLEQFYKYWALESLIGFWDGYAGNQNNFFLYANPKTGKFDFVPWGADFALTNSFMQTGAKSVKAKGLLAYHLYQNESVRERYLQELKKLMESIWQENKILAELDRLVALAEPELHSIQKEAFSQAVESTREFIKGRRAEIMEEIKDGAIKIDTPPAKPMRMIAVGTGKATFQAEWTQENNTTKVDSGTATMELEVDGEVIEFTKVGTTAEPAIPFGPPQPGERQPTVVLLGESTEDKKQIRLTLIFANDAFADSKGESIPVQAFAMLGGQFDFANMRMGSGEAKLTEADRKPGSKVIGEVKIKLFKMENGFGAR